MRKNKNPPKERKRELTFFVEKNVLNRRNKTKFIQNKLGKRRIKI